MVNQPDLFTLVEALNEEIKRLTDLNKRLVAAAKELGSVFRQTRRELNGL
jgi:hypothetical protein